MNYEIPISFVYLGLTEFKTDREKRKKLFYQYVEGYIERSYPEYKLDEIKGMKAICKRKGD